MKYALWIVFGLIVIGSIQSERDKQQTSESIAAFETARQEFIQSIALARDERSQKQ
jgi:hypothetical protein